MAGWRVSAVVVALVLVALPLGRAIEGGAGNGGVDCFACTALLNSDSLCEKIGVCKDKACRLFPKKDEREEVSLGSALVEEVLKEMEKWKGAMRSEEMWAAILALKGGIVKDFVAGSALMLPKPKAIIDHKPVFDKVAEGG